MLPLAISDHQGNPKKGLKKFGYWSFGQQIQELPTTSPFWISTEWQPPCCLLEGMFAINAIPLEDTPPLEAMGDS